MNSAQHNPQPHAINFRLVALPASEFQHLPEMSEGELEKQGIRRLIADEHPGYPCRVSLADADVGDTLYLLCYTHHDVTTPYRASGPIFVREGVATVTPKVNEVPLMLRRRLLSVRGYDKQGYLLGADVVDGETLETAITRLFTDPAIAYLHIHNAKPGCFDCRVERVQKMDK